MNIEFTVDYFIEKFSEIPDDQWNVGDYLNAYNPNCMCVLGHCGVRYDPETDGGIDTPEGNELSHLFSIHLGLHVTAVNDRSDLIADFMAPSLITPKSRILAALNKIKQEHYQ